MTSEVANILLNAKDDMTGVEIALVAVIRDLQQRVEEIRRVLEEVDVVRGPRLQRRTTRGRKQRRN
jgi:hypothetical protein